MLIQNISHDFKTPLNAIMSNSYFIKSNLARGELNNDKSL